MSIKFWEMKKDGTQYKDNNEFLWYYHEQKERIIKADSSYISVTDFYNHRELIEEITFEEIIDWSKIPIDTKILVWSKIAKQKYNRHFAGIDSGTGRVRAWDSGQTSFTTTRWNTWDCAELYADTIFALKEGM